MMDSLIDWLIDWLTDSPKNLCVGPASPAPKFKSNLWLPVITGLTGNNFNIKLRLQFYQHGGRFERTSLIDRVNSHFIIIMACCCTTRILHRSRQATEASQKHKSSSISKRQDGKHFLVRAGENVVHASRDGKCFRTTGHFANNVFIQNY